MTDAKITTTEKCIKADYHQITVFGRSCRNCNHTRWNRDENGELKSVCNLLNIQTEENYVCKHFCNPCLHCKHHYGDESVGVQGSECSAEDNGLMTNIDEMFLSQGESAYPCPSYVPKMASDGLLDQLANEELARLYLEGEEEMARLYQEE